MYKYKLCCSGYKLCCSNMALAVFGPEVHVRFIINEHDFHAPNEKMHERTGREREREIASTGINAKYQMSASNHPFDD